MYIFTVLFYFILNYVLQQQTRRISISRTLSRPPLNLLRRRVASPSTTSIVAKHSVDAVSRPLTQPHVTRTKEEYGSEGWDIIEEETGEGKSRER